MTRVAHSSARSRGFNNCAFFQGGVGKLPGAFRHKFDVVYSSLSHHHLPDPHAAATGVCAACERVVSTASSIPGPPGST